MRPTINTNINKIGWTSSSERVKKLADPTPPHINKLKRTQWITQSPEKNIPSLSFMKWS